SAPERTAAGLRPETARRLRRILALCLDAAGDVAARLSRVGGPPLSANLSFLSLVLGRSPVAELLVLGSPLRHAVLRPGILFSRLHPAWHASSFWHLRRVCDDGAVLHDPFSEAGAGGVCVHRCRDRAGLHELEDALHLDGRGATRERGPVDGLRITSSKR